MSSSHPPPQNKPTTLSSPTLINSTAKTNILPSATLLASIFQTDPAITWLLHSLSAEKRRECLPEYFKALLTAAALNDVIFTSIEGEAKKEEWKSVGLLMPPGKKVDNPWTLIPAGLLGTLWRIGFGGCYRMLGEFSPVAAACKAKGLRGRTDYYYIFFLGTAVSERGKGLCSTIVKQYQETAQTENKPLWLEATTEFSMKLYAKLGFEMVDVIVLGKGKVGADGLPRKDGEGVSIWGMVWWPKENHASEAES